ncbi:MAG: methyltransferase [Desulfobacteraceae bacterium]|nr:methyltransferase [Desulfobacteraceae bacterium]
MYHLRKESSGYANLHIYYFKGRLSHEPSSSASGYIGNWEEQDDSFLFFTSPAGQIIESLTASQPHLVFQDYYQILYEDWQGGAVEPYTIGRLMICPPWRIPQTHEGKNIIVLDPGVVFGSGSHPTTRDCLSALHMAIEHQAVSDVLDIGTGTGVLAIAAAALGASRVLALDLNRLATLTALANVRNNRLSHKILVVQGNAENYMDLASDLMISNIDYTITRPMVESQSFFRHKQFIISGLMRSQAREIESILNSRSIKILRKWEQDGTWFTYWGKIE